MTERIIAEGKSRWFISSLPDAELLNFMALDEAPVVANSDGVEPMTEITHLVVAVPPVVP